MTTTHKSFSIEVAWAYDNAWRDAEPFVPSRSQIEAALQPVIDRLKAMPREDAVEFIRATYALRGAMPMALDMFKTQTGA